MCAQPYPDCFPVYQEFSPEIPIHCITPDIGGCFHRFFDSSPISPSGRYVGLTRLRDENHIPGPADVVDIVLVDLLTGKQQIVAQSRCFGTQLGAQVQWGKTDQELYYNDLNPGQWQPFAIRLDPFSGEQAQMQGPVYMISPDGRWLASPCLLRTELTQSGYGAIVPPAFLPLNSGADHDDGLYMTDTRTGHSKLLVSFRQIVSEIPELQKSPYENGGFYGFHVKWNLQGTRLMFILRYRYLSGGKHQKMPTDVITMYADGTNIQLALPSLRRLAGGHHPNWTPDGDYITQNLVIGGKIRFVKYRYDGDDFSTLTERIGSGHPIMHPNGRYLITDTYTHESLAYGDGTTPLRLIDVETGKERVLARIQTKSTASDIDTVMRVDPHPTWDSTFQRIVFNACPDGIRRVFVADLSDILM